jgi:hypothetical protein
MPYGTVNLKHGVPKGETTVTCTAGVGTFLTSLIRPDIRCTKIDNFCKLRTLSLQKGWPYKGTNVPILITKPILDLVFHRDLNALIATFSKTGSPVNRLNVTIGRMISSRITAKKFIIEPVTSVIETYTFLCIHVDILIYRYA